jgi:hypothetical protein
LPQIKHMRACLKGLLGQFRTTLPWSAAQMAYSLIRPKFQISNIRHDGILSIGNFMLMMKQPKNLEFEPVHPKNVLLASVVHGISYLFKSFFKCPIFKRVFLYQVGDKVWIWPKSIFFLNSMFTSKKKSSFQFFDHFFGLLFG